MNLNEFLQLKSIERQRVNFEMIYVDMTGDLISGLLLSQIIYWFSPDKNGKSKLRVTYKGKRALAKARNEWFDEIRITAKQYDKAIKILERLKIVEVVNSMFDAKRTPFIMLNDEHFMDSYSSNLINASVLPKSKDRYSHKVNTDITEKLTPLTEITTEITTDITKSYNTVNELTDSKNNFYINFKSLIDHINIISKDLYLRDNFNSNKDKVANYFRIFYNRLEIETKTKGKKGIKQKVLTNKQLEDSINYCLEAIEEYIFTDNDSCLFNNLLDLYFENAEFKTLNGFFSKFIQRMSGLANTKKEEDDDIA